MRREQQAEAERAKERDAEQKALQLEHKRQSEEQMDMIMLIYDKFQTLQQTRGEASSQQQLPITSTDAASPPRKRLSAVAPTAW